MIRWIDWKRVIRLETRSEESEPTALTGRAVRWLSRRLVDGVIEDEGRHDPVMNQAWAYGFISVEWCVLRGTKPYLLT